jgi:Cu2+-containing amine oxidase
MNDKQTSLAASHPLDRLSENESSAAVGLVKADSRFGPKMRFGSVNLCAPENRRSSTLPKAPPSIERWI